MNKYLLKYNTDTWIKDPVTYTINKFIEGWKEKAKKSLIVDDVAAEFYKVSTNVVIQVLLGNVTPPPSNHHDELLRLFSSSVKKIFETTTKLYGIPLSLCQRLNLKIWTDFKECVDLSLLLANKLVNEMLAIKNEGDGLIKKLVDENIDDVNISRIVTDFIIAAGDTTAYTSLWIIYLLSKNPQEINNIRCKGRDYIPFVIKESMRLYPVAPFLTRIMPKDCYLGEYEIKAGDGLLQFHEVTGLSWWAAILSSTILIRALITLPLSVYQNYILAKVENVGMELKDIVNELKKETAMAKKAYNLNDKQTVILFKRSLKKQWRILIERDNCHPLKATIVIWFQIPLWVCMSFALRNLVNMNPPDPSAMVTFMELSTGGIGWIPNLIEPDHSLILPVAFGLTNLAIIEIQRMSKLRTPSKLYNVFTNVFRVFSIAMIPIAANVPSCMCLYWVTSSSFGLIQNMCLLSPSLRRKLRIPLAPRRDEQYFTDPEKFLPSRWDRNSISKERFINHEPSASLPFALGARSCVGRKIAMLQLTELIWQVVDNFDFECLHSDNIKAITSQVLIPNKTYALELKLCNK
ncbi:unnamed protein product [Colias eurytheme]|nr:unnamed protein product [Colias eurytheme]